MQRFSTWALGIAGSLLTGAAVGLVVTFIKQQPQETANVPLQFLLFLLDQTWFLLVGAFVAGLLLNWIIGKLDDFRADKRKALGTEMVSLGYDLGNLRNPTPQARSQIMSCLTAASKLGIWVPDQRVFNLEPGRAYGMIRDYLMHVGTLLKDGHFAEARRYAVNSKAAFNSAYRGRERPIR